MARYTVPKMYPYPIVGQSKKLNQIHPPLSVTDKFIIHAICSNHATVELHQLAGTYIGHFPGGLNKV